MDSSKTGQFLTNKIIQTYCITLALLEDYSKQTANNTGEHPESVKRRLMLNAEKIRAKLTEELSANK